MRRSACARRRRLHDAPPTRDSHPLCPRPAPRSYLPYRVFSSPNSRYLMPRGGGSTTTRRSCRSDVEPVHTGCATRCADRNTPHGCTCQQEAVLKATAVRSPLPVISPILPCPLCLSGGECPGVGGLRTGGVQGQGSWGGEWGQAGGGGRGHFIHLVIYTVLPHGASPQRDFAQWA